MTQTLKDVVIIVNAVMVKRSQIHSKASTARQVTCEYNARSVGYKPMGSIVVWRPRWRRGTESQGCLGVFVHNKMSKKKGVFIMKMDVLHDDLFGECEMCGADETALYYSDRAVSLLCDSCYFASEGKEPE